MADTRCDPGDADPHELHVVFVRDAVGSEMCIRDRLGVEYNAHAIESILRFVAPELGWR